MFTKTTSLCLGVIATACIINSNAIAQPCMPTLLGSAELENDPEGIAGADSFVFVAVGNDGVRVIDAQDPSLPQIVTTIDTPGFAHDIVIANDSLYIADGDAGIRIYSISDPANPVLLGQYSFPATPNIDIQSLVERNGMLFVIDTKTGLKVLDVSSPMRPQLVGEDPDAPDPQLRASKIAIAHGTATVSYVRFNPNATPGVRLLNIINPAAPVPVGWLETPGEPSGLAAIGATLFVGDFLNTTLSSYDILDASSPLLMDTMDVFQIVDLSISGNELYVQTKNEDLKVIDIHDPADLSEIGMIDTPSNTRCISIENGQVLLSEGGLTVPFDREASMQIYDVSSCQSPVCAADFTDDNTLDIFDVLGFVEAFTTSNPSADFTGEGIIDIFDVLGFIAAFNAGCP